MAGATGIGNHLAGAVAARAGLLDREEALLHAHLADTAASGAGDRCGAGLGAAAVASLATDQGRHADGDGGAAYRLFQVEIQGVAQVRAALRAAARATAGAAATEEIAEHIAEDVGEARPAETGASAPTHVRIDAGMAVLVVGRPLAGIGEDLVGLVGLLELVLGFLVARIAVRVVFHRQATVGLLQVRLAGATLNPQNLVKVSFRHNLSVSIKDPPDTPTREQAPAWRIMRTGLAGTRGRSKPGLTCCP